MPGSGHTEGTTACAEAIGRRAQLKKATVGPGRVGQKPDPVGPWKHTGIPNKQNNKQIRGGGHVTVFQAEGNGLTGCFCLPQDFLTHPKELSPEP